MKTYVRINNEVVAEIILPAERLEADRPAAPVSLDADASPDQIAQYAIEQSLHDSYVAGEIPIEERFTPQFVSSLVDVTDVSPLPAYGWTYAAGVFTAPVPYTPSPDEVLAANKAQRDVFLSVATLAIAPLQDAVDLDDASAADTAKLKLWKQYRVAVNRVDLTVSTPVWPASPA